MDFEELALKSVDTSLGPRITNLSRREEKITEESESGTHVVSTVPHFRDHLANRLT